MNISQGRLAIFLPGLYDGGAERILLNLAEGIAIRGIPVDLVLARAEGPYLCEVPDKVRMIDLNAPRTLLSLPMLVHYLRRERPAAMLSALYANIVAVCAQRITGIPQRLVISEHNTLSRVSKGENDLRWKLYPELAKRFYPLADCVIAVSDGVADDLKKVTGLSASQVRIIYNPVVTKDLFRKSEQPLDHPWFRDGAPPVILGVGRLTAQKAFDVLIEAFAQVRRSQRVRLVILGEGEDRPVLEALIRRLGLEEDTELPGFVANPYPYMAHAAVFVLSSRWEGLPTVLVEAMSLGIPVISTDCPSGPQEILRGGQYGRLVRMNDPVALSIAVQDALSHHTVCPHKDSWKPYELDFVTDQYLDLLVGSSKN